MFPSEYNHAQVYNCGEDLLSGKDSKATKSPSMGIKIESLYDYSLGESLSGFALEIVPSLLSIIILGVLRICS